MSFESLEKVFYNKLKDSKIDITKGCLGDDTYFIKCYIAKDSRECAWNILDNDMLSVMFRVQILANGDFELTNCAKSYLIKPNNKYYAYGRRDLSFRKVIGDLDKITASFDKFLDKMIDNLKADLQADLIHDNHKDLLRAKLGL